MVKWYPLRAHGWKIKILNKKNRFEALSSCDHSLTLVVIDSFEKYILHDIAAHMKVLASDYQYIDIHLWWALTDLWALVY